MKAFRVTLDVFNIAIVVGTERNEKVLRTFGRTRLDLHQLDLNCAFLQREVAMVGQWAQIDKGGGLGMPHGQSARRAKGRHGLGIFMAH